MSTPYDVFENLNDYLNKNDDCDFPDEELGGDDPIDQELDADEIPPPIKQKRGAKKNLIVPDPIPSKKTRRQVVQANVSSDDEDLSGPSASSSHSSLQSRPSRVKSVDLAGDDLDGQLKEVQKQYELIFSNPSCIQQDKRFFSSVKRRFQSLMKRQQSARGRRNDVFMKEFESLKEILFNVCVNWNLLPPSTSYSTSETSSAPTGRRRRQQEPELINLVDSPVLILPGTINLDSDEECAPTSANNKNANLSFDSENYEVSLKIKWEGKIERFAHRKYQKFADLIAVLADRTGADPTHVILDLDERIIEPDDTPDTIGYRISQFITGRVVRGQLAEMFSKKKTNAAGTGKSNKPKDPNIITLKVQSDRWKKPLEVQVGKDCKMKIVVIKCAEELKCSPGDIRLSFDGDPVQMDSTPIDLELEGGEVLDIRFQQG